MNGTVRPNSTQVCVETDVIRRGCSRGQLSKHQDQWWSNQEGR